MADSLVWLANVGDPRLRLFNQIAKEAEDLGVSPIQGPDNFLDENALLVDDEAFGYRSNPVNRFDGAV